MTLETTGCRCDESTGTRCEFHARQPRPCTCGGTLQRYAGADGHVREHYHAFGRTAAGKTIAYRNDVPKLRRTSGAFWACNRCEHAEVAR